MTLSNFSFKKTGTILKEGDWIGVDLMMLLYSMLRSTASIWRAQTQLPPAPQRQAQAWMTSWYTIHEFERRKQVLVFVLDGRMPPHKVCEYHCDNACNACLFSNLNDTQTVRREQREQRIRNAVEGMKKAATLQQFEKHQCGACALAACTHSCILSSMCLLYVVPIQIPQS